ncbi:hypothetical protein CDAR_446561 [Caerostris darwini]|uniref:Uncharacterized protein n=1 Tax=Caerostris darwini TaxID=1538125 RepID=A0AAV4PNJ0_9ARAC|nr:hypothetical protein CDAR_446561 [Caerostris darwini]
MPAGAPLIHRLESDLSPFKSVGSSLSRGFDRRKLSRFAIRRSEFLWTAASYTGWRSLIALNTFLWIGAAAALCGLKASVLCGGWKRRRRLSMAWFV